MATQVLAPAKTEQWSPDQTLAAGSVATIFLKGLPVDEPARTVGPSCLHVQFKLADGANYARVGQLDETHRQVVLRGPLTWRVGRPGAMAVDIGAEVEVAPAAGSSGPQPSATSQSVTPAPDANVARELYSVSIVSQATSGANGATYVAFGNAPCTALEIVNTRADAVDIEYQRGGAATAGIVIPAGYSRLIDGITNASQIAIRRRDAQLTSVTVMAEARAVA
ncbi:hypothetical protein [Pseudacidovorax intermedius]|uniref:hypothetical protein n=1 Tax=Pseudacidovorax intermedius TaxID=433924 RepID=UPI0026ECE430|nr:hypothetical protein [Pseudacidovorax intermedius]